MFTSSGVSCVHERTALPALVNSTPSMQRVLKAVRRRDPNAESEFVSHCRAYGKCNVAETEQNAKTFVTFLQTTFGDEFANALVPELVKLLPDEDKCAALMHASGITIDEKGGVVTTAAASGGEGVLW